MSSATSRHVKFGESDSESIPSESRLPAIAKKHAVQESDESSDSDAPEEETQDATRRDLQSQEDGAREARRREQQALREKRREQDKLFREQQELKRQRQKHDESVGDDEVEELPEEFIQRVQETRAAVADATAAAAENKHINFHDLETTDDLERETVQQIKRAKKRSLKSLRRAAVNKGPVTVQLLDSAAEKRPPKRETQIMATRDRWLKRKSLRRR
ncbi:Bud21p KNAG_0L01990 [Huiozyma naganishii CBS 8797]|uniref:Uncharacterized protein n=1 Tax=Huiozyma naganishii (strain ATCC MYA-139 / BCRC 22969 / CBS 8797 / KCTC 17520 / NBRC 10181 / NCYC 3082 / Yp74L-3) TaxID=1071383 RepID=J7RSC3_HUIN7|nr:hypothetical protein KNAG_0L01990 [Kazachstania naganishii CBS 8797]CCK72818.1 hypothetical protein KNAG_0L01990 [Kazachstania naganishii CBS 8797]